MPGLCRPSLLFYLGVEGSSSLRLSLQNFLNLVQDLRGELWHHVESLEVIFELFDLGSTEDDVGNARVDSAPSESEMCGSASQSFGTAGKSSRQM